MSEPNGFLGLMSHPGASSRLQLDNAVNLLQEMRIGIIIKLPGKIKTPRQIDNSEIHHTASFLPKCRR